jgi:NAD(P)-dependent dehydrogenase (short-subunit alcohol dehydrogenase family)
MEFADPSINIRVNSIHPGGINTNMIQNIINTSVEETGTSEAEIRSQLEQGHPMQRLGSPKEVARVALFLASTDSSYMTGSEVVVDGGYTAS